MKPFSKQNITQISFVYSYKCNASCAHCCFSAGPSEIMALNPDILKDCLSSAKSYGCKIAGFTGGEILLFKNEIFQLLSYAKKLGYENIIATNGFWAKDRNATESIVKELKNRNVTYVIISASKYHNEFVPLKNVFLLIDLLTEYEISTQIEVFKSEGSLNSMIQSKLNKLKGPLVKIVWRSIGPFGRAKSLLKNSSVDSLAPQWTSCQNAFSPAIHPDGNVYLCCSAATGQLNPGSQNNLLCVGNVNSENLTTILKRHEQSQFANALAFKGFQHLRELKDDYQSGEGVSFSHECQECVWLGKTLWQKMK